MDVDKKLSREERRRIADRWSSSIVRDWISACQNVLWGYRKGIPKTFSKCPFCDVADRLRVGYERCSALCVWHYFTGYSCTDFAYHLEGYAHDDVPFDETVSTYSVWCGTRLHQLPQWIASLKRLLKEKERKNE